MFSRFNSLNIYQYIDRIKYNNSLKYKLISACLSFYLKFFKKKRILFIFGVQRSGTTITIDHLMKLFGVKGYHEFSELTNDGDEGLRFPAFKKIKERIHKNLEPFILIKPLVESQNADLLLESFNNSKGIWMYRNYRDVVSSFHKKFGSNVGKHHLNLILNNDSSNWRSERIPDHLRSMAIKLNKEGLTENDATALYWYIRNMLYFEYNFDQIKQLKLLKYEYFMLNNNDVIQKICAFWGYTFSISENKTNFKTDSIQKGKDIQINPKVEALCKEVLEKLDKQFQNQSYF